MVQKARGKVLLQTRREGRALLGAEGLAKGNARKLAGHLFAEEGRTWVKAPPVFSPYIFDPMITQRRASTNASEMISSMESPTLIVAAHKAPDPRLLLLNARFELQRLLLRLVQPQREEYVVRLVALSASRVGCGRRRQKLCWA